MEQQVVRETITYASKNVTDEDKALSAAFNTVALEALSIAQMYLRKGPEQARQVVVRSFLGSLAKLAAVDSQVEIEEHRMTLQRVLEGMSEVLPAEIEVTPSGAIDAASHAPLSDPVYQRTVDQDDEA